MNFVIFAVLTLLIFMQVIRASRKAKLPNQNVQALDQLGATGIPARGLVLDCSQYPVGVTLNQRRFERRTMTLEVEIPGREPYVTNGDFLVPRGLVEVIPGTSLDLAVDPSSLEKIAVLGPGDFTGPWLRLGPPQRY